MPFTTTTILQKKLAETKAALIQTTPMPKPPRPTPKLTETSFTLAVTEMGARVYLPSIGRFTQVDPEEGGTANNYVYPTDPVNSTDLSGMAQKGRQSRDAPSLSRRQQQIIDKIKHGQPLTKAEKKMAPSILRKANSTAPKFNLQKASRETKDMIKRGASNLQKGINKFFFYPIPMPKEIRDGFYGKPGELA